MIGWIEANLQQKMDLTDEVSTFKKNNELMSAQIMALGEQNTALSNRVKELSTLEKELQSAKKRLETTVDELTLHIKEQKELLFKQQQQVEHTLGEYHAKQKALDTTLIELEELKRSTALEIEQMKSAQSKLATLIAQLSTQVIEDKDKRQAFIARLNLFLDKKEESMEQFIQAMSQLNQNLGEATKQFEQLNDRHNLAFELHESLMSKLHGTDLESADGTKSRTNDLSIFSGPPSKSSVPRAQGNAGLQMGQKGP